MSFSGSRNHRLIKASRATCASFFVLASLMVSVSVVSAANSDFTIDATPTTLCVNPGINGQSVISLSSVGGFSGTVNLGGSVSPLYANSPTLSGIPPSVTLASGQTVSFDLTMSTTTSTPLFTYRVTVSGLAGSLHQVNIELTVSSACSVGGVIVPTTLGSIGSDLTLTITIAGLIGLTSVAFIVYVSRARTRAKQ